MHIRCNKVIFFVIFFVTSVNAKNIPENPAANYQSSPAKPSMIMSSSKINLPVSHIEAPEMSTAVTTSNPTLVTSTTSTTTVMSTYINTAATTTIKEMANNTTVTSSIEGTAGTQPVTITNVGMATETQTDENGMLVDRYVIKPPVHDLKVGKDQCPKGYSLTSNGNCKPSFHGH
ncbi:hypothetical protein QTP88_026883 [Uroleucon formosanum]